MCRDESFDLPASDHGGDVVRLVTTGRRWAFEPFWRLLEEHGVRSSFDPGAAALAAILALDLVLTLVHSAQELRGHLWRYFGAIEGARIPDVPGFLLFFVGLTLGLWTVGLAGIAGYLPFVRFKVDEALAMAAVGGLIGAPVRPLVLACPATPARLSSQSGAHVHALLLRRGRPPGRALRPGTLGSPAGSRHRPPRRLGILRRDPPPGPHPARRPGAPTGPLAPRGAHPTEGDVMPEASPTTPTAWPAGRRQLRWAVRQPSRGQFRVDFHGFAPPCQGARIRRAAAWTPGPPPRPPGPSCPLPTPSGDPPVKTNATIRVASLKVTVPLAADALPRDLVPMDGPAGEPTLDPVLEGTPLTARAKLNGKNYRKLLKQVDEQGAANVSVVLQGTLRPPAAPGGPFVFDTAGFQANVKAPRPAEPAGETSTDHPR